MKDVKVINPVTGESKSSYYPKNGDEFIVKYSAGYGSGAFRICLVAGSDVTNLSGTHTVCLKNGNIVKYMSGSLGGNTWWFYKGERMRYDGNGWCPFLYKNLVLKE